MANHNCLKICFTNIEGLTDEKLLLFSATYNADFLLLCETWLNDSCIDNISLPEYTMVYSNRKTKHPKARRFSGGLCVFYRSILNDVVSIAETTADMIWL